MGVILAGPRDRGFSHALDFLVVVNRPRDFETGAACVVESLPGRPLQGFLREPSL